MMFHKSIYNLIAWHAPTSWQREQLHGLQDYGGVTFWRLSVFVCACTCRYDFLGVVHGCVSRGSIFVCAGFRVCMHGYIFYIWREFCGGYHSATSAIQVSFLQCHHI